MVSYGQLLMGTSMGYYMHGKHEKSVIYTYIYIFIYIYIYITEFSCFICSSLKFLQTSVYRYPISLNISPHLIIGDFARRRQSLNSKCGKCRKLPGVVFYFFEVVVTLYMFVFSELSSLAKCKVRETLSAQG